MEDRSERTNLSSPTGDNNQQTSSIAEFNRLHAAEEILFLGNAWDTASALALERAGFPAIGTTSRGIANAFGVGDGERIPFGQHVSIVRDMVACIRVPVSADIESGYASSFAEIVDHALYIADAGAAGLNIEDSPKDRHELRGAAEQSQLLSLIRAALDARGFGDFFINARTDTYLMPGVQDPLAETLERALAYADSGASGIFVPGLSAEQEISAVAETAAIPLNVMSLPGLTSLSRLQELGVRRFSFGNAFSDYSFALLERAASELWSRQDTSVLYIPGEARRTI